jgi:hypothetical protein
MEVNVHAFWRGVLADKPHTADQLLSAQKKTVVTR